MPIAEKSNIASQPAVRGEHTAGGPGIFGSTDSHVGVEGFSLTRSSIGVYGSSTEGRGVVGVCDGNTAVEGNSGSATGVWGSSRGGEGVHAETRSDNLAAMAAFMLNENGMGAAVHAENRGRGVGIFAKGGRLAGLFEGDVEVIGDIQLRNADCAEDFDVLQSETVEAGTVMILESDGVLKQSYQAYDRRVAGVISGAAGYKPALILDRNQTRHNRMPIALLGKVYCKVDADYSPVDVGDLLTTSPTAGHAMRANDPLRAFGAVIGKAMRPLKRGQELIPILIALQ